MESEFTATNLPTILNSNDSGEVIKALQYLIANLYLANTPEINDCVKQLTQSTDVGVRFWAKKLSNSVGKYETEQANAQIAAISKDLPVDILIQKLQSIASTYLSLDVIKKLCESRKDEAQDFLKNYLASCNDNIQISYLTKNIGIYFPSEENLLFLMPYLKHADDRIVANTIEGVEAIGSSKGVIVLSQLLEHKSNRVRTNAAIALGKFDAEKSFAVISKMLAPESDAHFRISACHAIKTLQDPRFLEQLEPALLDDTTFSAALESIAAIGGQPAIALLTKNYSQIPVSKQSQVDSIAAKLSRLEEKPLEKLGEKIKTSKAFTKVNFFIDTLKEKLTNTIFQKSSTQSQVQNKQIHFGQTKNFVALLLFFTCITVFYFLYSSSSKSPPTQTPHSSQVAFQTVTNNSTSATNLPSSSSTVSLPLSANLPTSTASESAKDRRTEKAYQDIMQKLEQFRQGKRVDDLTKQDTETGILQKLRANQTFTFEEIRSASGWNTNEIAKELIGKKVLWEGWFSRINYGDLYSDKYCCMIDMDSPDDVFSAAEISLEVNEQLAQKFVKNSKIQFSGKIYNATNLAHWTIEIKEPRILAGLSTSPSAKFITKQQIIKHIEAIEKKNSEFVKQIKNQSSITFQEICEAFSREKNDQEFGELDAKVILINHRASGGKALGLEKYNPTGDSLNTRISNALIGKRVRWSGWVKHVSGGWLTDYGCEIDFDPPETIFSSPEVEFKTTKEIADKLKRENKIEFEGTIRNVSGLVKPYITLDNNPRIISGLED